MKWLITWLLEKLAGRRMRAFQGDVVVVAGSVGKTGTTTAIASVLAQTKKVLATTGFNTEIGVPLVILEIDLPASLKNPLQWLSVLSRGWRRSSQPLNYDVLVLELGVDRPDDMDRFRRYIHADLAVLTAITAEHLAYFGSLRASQAEELKVATFADKLLVNSAMIQPEMLASVPSSQVAYYGPGSAYQLKKQEFSLDKGYTLTIAVGDMSLAVHLKLLGQHSLAVVLAAVAVGEQLNLTKEQLTAGLARLKPLAGRMHLLPGYAGSWLIDDTYNAVGPESVEAGLQTLYDLPAKHRIAILGSMNEIGSTSPAAHRRVGAFCDPTKLDLVVTVGSEAQDHLAPAAKKQGCQVESFRSPAEAGNFVRAKLSKDTVVLVKGSQNGVFAEEAAKQLLKSDSLRSELVRQSPDWLARKRAQGLLG